MAFDQETRTEIHRQRFTRVELARIDAECERVARNGATPTTRCTRSRLIRLALDRYFRAVKKGKVI